MGQLERFEGALSPDGALSVQLVYVACRLCVLLEAENHFTPTSQMVPLMPDAPSLTFFSRVKTVENGINSCTDNLFLKTLLRWRS